MTIAAPAPETAWLLRHVLGFTALTQADTAAILSEATRFAESELLPLDQPGDRIGARLVDGGVVLPPGFAEAFGAYARGGWIGIAADPDHGGQGLPEALALAASEPVTGANLAFSLCPMLTRDAIALLAAHGTADQRLRLMEPMIGGDWTGTMCLTEPHAGSDLSGVRTRAVPDPAGGILITGEKIYITWGEHAMAGNILHMVLARLPDAPAGSAGISLFAVPRTLPGGTRNGVTCLSLERKMGIHASPTCALRFEHARGEMVGAPHRGLACMFAMMNAARLGVAMQGVAIAERAFRRAAAYAAMRVQGGGAIELHPDVRRMLWTMRALALGGRLLTLHAALAEEPLASLLIPVAKAWSTEAGIEAASLGVQVHGGAGFIEDTGAAQHLRDVRIAAIYEGTNGIQALTLLRRGLLRDQGAAMAALLAAIAGDPASPSGVRHGAETAGLTAAWLRRAAPREAEAGATAFLNLVGTLVAGWLCARVRADHGANGPAPAAASAAAGVFLDHILPRLGGYAHSAMTPSRPVIDPLPIG